jgi:VCBS repeat-containing protein
MYQLLFGTTAWTVLTTVTNFIGSFRNDIVFSSFRNDTISTGDGNDYVDSGAGNDILTLGRGNDTAYAGSGDDTVDAGEGNDFVDAGSGSDVVRAGSGNDIVFLGNGNDQAIYRADATAGLDRYNGGQGFDTLVLELTAAQQASAAFLLDRAAFNTYLAAGGNGNFQFQSLGLTITGGFEALRIDSIGGQPVNTAPVVSGAVTLPGGTEDTSVTITAASLLANATDAEANALSVVNLTASSGTVVNNGNGTWTFTPAANANGPVTFTYSVSDGALSTAATATINIAAVNDGPVVAAPAVLAAAAEDSTVTITAAQLLAGASDIDSATLSVVGLAASSGTLVNNGNGTWSFTPAANDDTSVSFTYQVSDGQASVNQTATLDLTAVNDGPVVSAPVTLAAIAEDSAATTITAAQLLAGASDIDSATLSITDLVLVGGGTLVANGPGSWLFTPAANDDTSVSFTYKVSDGELSVNQTATLDLTPVNDAPDAGLPIVLPAIDEDSFATFTASDLLANATDIDSESISVLNVRASSGTLFQDEGGNYNFTPDLNDDTEVTFEFDITDGELTTVGTATLDLLPVNDLPEVGPRSQVDFAILYGETTNGFVQATDVETPAGNLEYSLYLDEANTTRGTVSLNADGTYAYTAPTEGFEEGTPYTGPDSFIVQVTDADGGSELITVQIEVGAAEYEFTYQVDANSNRGALVGTTNVQDTFSFSNIINEDGSQFSSGTDYLQNFDAGQDSIFLDGNYYTPEDIIANRTFDANTEENIYTISDTGATIVTYTNLQVSDFFFLLQPS